MSHIFISYSKQNKAYARRLAEHLIAHGFDVWIDDRIDYGSLWADVIQKAIEDCAAFVVIMTPEARDSHWVQTECEYAAQKRKKIFPLLLEGTEFFRYVSVQYVDVTDGSLPPDAFLTEVAEYAPRKPGHGANVTAPEVAIEEQLPVSDVKIPSRIWPRVGVGIVAALLVITLILALQNQPADDETTLVATPTDLAAVSLQTSTPHEGNCRFDWFFGNEYAVSGDCPVSAASEVDGLMQAAGDGMLLGMAIANTGDAQFFILNNNGSYFDVIGDWDTSTIPFGECVLPTAAGLKEPLSYEGTPDEIIGCPIEPIRFEVLNYQVRSASTGFVVYIGTSEVGVYRLAADSSRSETTGEWRQVR